MVGLQGVLFTQATQDSHSGLVADPGAESCAPPWCLCALVSLPGKMTV